MQLEADIRIQQAIAIIGPDQPSDYIIAPTKHAAQYAESAPELARLLQSSEARIAAESYEDLDQRAVEAQRQFLTASNRTGIAVFFTALFGALLLVVANFSDWLGAYLLYAVLATAIGGVIAGNLAAMWIYSIRAGGLFEQWKTRRAEAEAERLRYFEVVTGKQDISEPLLQLEYFRRYQLDVQRVFFRNRGKQHAAGAGRALRLSSGALAVAGIMTGVAGVVAAATLDPRWASLAIVALVAQGFGAYIDTRESSAQHRRNTERYLRSRQALDKLYGMLDSVRAATAQGDRAVMHQFVGAVHAQLAVEHQEWQREIGAAGEVVNQLEALLEKHQETFRNLPGRGGSVVKVESAVFQTRSDGADRVDAAPTPVLPSLSGHARTALPQEAGIIQGAPVVEEHDVLEEDAGLDEGVSFPPRVPFEEEEIAEEDETRAQ